MAVGGYTGAAIKEVEQRLQWALWLKCWKEQIDEKSLGLNAFLNGIRSVLNLLFPLLTFPYVSRILGATGMGKYNFANYIVSYFLMIAALGINTYAVREGARIRDDRKKFSNFASQFFSYNVVSTVASYVLLFSV